MRFLKKKLCFMLVLVFIVQCAGFSPVFAASANSDSTNYGFKLVRQTYIDSSKTTAMEYVHVKSGAKLIFLENADPNKTFSISFRTPPSDNTGVNHIIEHCLLDGSQKYPVNNMLKMMSNRSLYSNANGTAYADHTDFYIQTSNNKDYMNLMGVILDAVFYPNLLNNRNIFLQEGGHYELDADKSKASYTGVVYGEMGTEYPEDTLINKSIESVLPDTIYKWHPAGSREDIPDVTYDKVLNTYKKYYHPSNSYIYLYGNLDINEALKYIDNNYLSKFKNEKVDSEISLQKPFEKGVEKTYYYNISNGTPTENSTYFSQSYVIDKATNAELVNAFNAIYPILIPKLNKAAAERGLNLGISGLFQNFAQPVFYISCNQANENQKAEFKKIIDDTLKDIVTNGIDKEEIKSLILSYENEKSNNLLDVNRGIGLINNVMWSWINGGDPVTYLDADSYINVLAKELNGRYLENIIQKYLIGNKHKSFVVLKAQNNSGTQDKGVIDAKTLYKSQLDKIISDTNGLKTWQSQVNSEAALSKLPLLSVSDMKLDSPAVNISSIDGTKMLFTPMETNNTSYYNLYFDTSMVEQDKIPYLNLLCYILTNGGSKVYDKFKSANGIGNPTNISFSADAYGRFDSTSIYSPKIKAFAFAPDGNMDKSLQSLKEIITSSDFKNKDEIKGFINDSKASAKIYITYYRFPAYFSEKDRYIENLMGLPYYNFLSDLDSNFDSKWSEIQKNLTDVYNTVFNKNSLIVGFVGTNDAYVRFQKNLPDFLKDIKSVKYAPVHYAFHDVTKNEAFIRKSQNINLVAKGYNFKKLGYSYSGSMQVLEAVLDDYLFDRSRTSGGYGGYASISQDGNIYFNVARMPDITKSLAIYDTLPSYLKNFKANDNELMTYKIGAIKRITTPKSQVWTAMENQEATIMGKTQKDYEKELNEILGTTQEDINKMAQMVDSVIKQNVFLVLGNKEKINEQKNIFSRVLDISQ